MSCLGRVFSILLVTLLTLSSLIMVQSAFAQTPTPSLVPIPKPSVPEFTLELADHSYDVPARTTSTTDPYTGKTTTYTSPAYHVQNLTIDVIFRKQYYPATINGYQTTLYYDITTKPHYTEDWYGPYDKGWFPAKTNSEYTTISFSRIDYPSEGEVDFRVQAYLGYHYNYEDYSHIQPIPQSSFSSSASDWSNTQTINLADGSVSVSTSPTPNPTPSPSATLSSIIPTSPIDSNSVDSNLIVVPIAVAVLAILFIFLLLYVRHLKRSIAKPDNSTL